MDFQSVGEKACTIMVTIVHKVNEAEQPNRRTDRSSLEKDCDDLKRYVCGHVFKGFGSAKLICYSVMEIVKKIVHKHLHGRRRFVLLKRVLYSRLDQEVIKDCKQRLQDALDTFTVSVPLRKKLP